MTLAELPVSPPFLCVEVLILHSTAFYRVPKDFSLCCNRAATGVGNTRTQPDSLRSRKVQNRLYKPNSLTRQDPPGEPRPNLQGGGRWFEPSIAHL
jgi:hypothetical protein